MRVIKHTNILFSYFLRTVQTFKFGMFKHSSYIIQDKEKHTPQYKCGGGPLRIFLLIKCFHCVDNAGGGPGKVNPALTNSECLKEAT